MKLYIAINKTPIQGYLHIDPSPKGDVPAFKGNLNDLSKIVEDGECTEILAPEILNLIFDSTFDQIVEKLCSLLRHKGKLIIGGIELHELSRLVFLGAIEPQQYNQILFAGSFRMNGIYTLEKIKNKLQSLNMTIEKVEIDGFNMLIEAIRP